MAEFYGYAEREADSYINWGEISKNMSDMIVKTNQAREDKKKAIDDATNELSNYINNEQPFGEHKDASTAALNLGSQASNFLLAQHKLLKSGQLRPEDFVMNRERLKSSITASYNALKNYQSSYAQLMNDYKDKKISYGQLLNAAQVEKFGNFTTSGFFVTPTTGEIVIAEKEERIIDGKKVYVMSSNPSKVTTPNAINSLIVGNWNRYDQESNAKEWVESIGEKQLVALREIGTRTKAGSITTLLDPTNEAISTYTDDQKNIIAEFKVAEDNRINAMLSNNYDRASLMLDYIRTKDGKQFETVYDNPEAAKKDPTKINMVKDKNTGGYVPEFTEEQIKISNDWMRQDLRARYDRKQEMRPVSDYNAPSYAPQPTEGQLKRQDEAKNARVLGRLLAETMYGNPAQVRSAASALEQYGEGYSNIRRTKRGLVLTDLRGGIKEISFYDENGRPLSPSQIARSGTWFMPNADVSLLEEGAKRVRQGQVYDTEYTSLQRPSGNPGVVKYVSDYLWFDKTNPRGVSDDINSKFGSKLGVNATYRNSKIVLSNGATEVEIDPKDSNAKDSIRNFLNTSYNRTVGDTQFPILTPAPGGGILSGY